MEIPVSFQLPANPLAYTYQELLQPLWVIYQKMVIYPQRVQAKGFAGSWNDTGISISFYSSLVLAVNEQYQTSICWLSPLVLPATFVLHSFSVFHPTKCGRDLIKISQVGGHLTSLRSGKWLFVAGMAISLFNFQCGTNLVAGHFLPGLSWAFFQSTLDTEGAKIQIYSEILRT